jgi:hypothetical protein
MVQANLEGRKTTTRRIVDPQPIWNVDKDGNLYEGNHKGYVKVDGHPDWAHQFAHEFAKRKKGDLIWVRENFRVNSWVPDDGELTFRYEADGAVSPYLVVDDDESDCENFNRYWQQSCDDLLKAGYQPDKQELFHDYDYRALRLRPNIFLPKVAARIWLQVASVRVERLQDISEEDAKAEGIEAKETKLGPSYIDYNTGFCNGLLTAKECFRTLWQSINGGDSWQGNPWVWVISYNILSTTGKPYLTEKSAPNP